MFNPGGDYSFQAFTGPNGMGTSLATFNLSALNFQPGSKYFMGVLSTNADIRSLVLNAPEPQGDSILFDDVKIGRLGTSPTAPEPGTGLLFAVPLGTLLARRILRRESGHR